MEKVFPYQKWRRLNFRKLFFQLTGIFFLILALTGPKFGQKLQEIKTSGGNIFILFDCSNSMLAEDFKPNRLEKSKRMLTGLLEKLYGDRVGIIAFAGEPYIYCPLTFDSYTAKQFLRGIEAGMVPDPGTRIGSAVRLALGKMPEMGTKTIILLTDGEDHKSDPLGAAEECKKSNVKIFAIGIGNPEGEPIPVYGEGGKVVGYKKNQKGEVVLSRMDESTLAQMALMTGGTYFRASGSEEEIDLLGEQLENMDKLPALRKENIYENQYQWFLLIAFILLALGEAVSFTFPGQLKISSLAVWLSFLILYVVTGSSLLRAESFQKKIKEGNKLFKEEKYSEALENYEEASQKKHGDLRARYNAGAAAYKLQDWERSVEEFQKSALSKDSNLAARSLYNLGNSQFQKGLYSEAAGSFKQSLRLNPRDEDAKFNLKLALQYKKNPPPPQNQKSDDKRQNQKESGKKNQETDKQKQEREENAKRMLKSGSNDDQNKPSFKPDPKKGKKEYVEDW